MSFGILQWLISFIAIYKYGAIFAILFIGGLVTPYPSGIAIVAAGYLSARGYLSMPLLLVWAVLGSIAGDQMAYWVSRKFGEPVLSRIGLRRAIASKRFKQFEERLAARPILTIFLSRFSFTQIVNILAGLANVPYPTFFVVSVIGEAADVALLVALGVFFGEDWSFLSGILAATGTIAGILLAFAVYRSWRRD